eukprot:4627888-Pyramimonas_sp.AAC.1
MAIGEILETLLPQRAEAVPPILCTRATSAPASLRSRRRFERDPASMNFALCAPIRRREPVVASLP